MFVVNPCCDVIPKEIIEGYRNIPVANIGDARGRFGCMSWMIKPMNPDMRLCGPALTVQTYRADNLAIHVALEMARPGDVLVIDDADLDALRRGNRLALAPALAAIAARLSSHGSDSFRVSRNV